MAYKNSRAGDLKVGSYALIDNEPCQIVDIEKSKPGKHGSAKIRASGISLFDGKKKTYLAQADAGCQVPIVDKRSGQIVSITPGQGVQLMDLETYETIEIAMPTDEDIASKIRQGKEVEYSIIMGLTIARELVQNGWENIVVIEKEAETGKHASGRNSGVLHAGIYYAPDSLKATSCLNGNFLMKAYCREKQLPLLETGKVIVARSEDEIPVLQTLYERAIANGAKVDLLNEKELAEIEPNARTVRQAIFSHYTAVVDPQKILKSLQGELEGSGKVRFLFNCAFETVAGSDAVQTQCGRIRFKRFINAAGAHCDRISKAFGIGAQYRLIPFKGIYRKLKKDSAWRVRGSIYPVPDIRNPFLGVHFTRNIHGDVYLGLTAIPAFGRENYGVFEGMDKEAIDILLSDAHLFLK